MNQDKSEKQDIGCLEAIEKFYAYIDGELKDTDSVADFEHHMEHCRSCFSRAEMERSLLSHIKKTAETRPEGAAPEGLRSRMRALMEKF